MFAKGTKDVAFIMAGDGLIYQGCISSGCNVFHPFKDRNLLMRILREAWQITRLPKTDLFFEKKILQNQFEHIIIYDALITRRYLAWIRGNFPLSKIHFVYNNMVGMARHLKPDQLPSWIDAWTYDDHDSSLYSLKKYRGFYFRSFCLEPREKEIDVFFIGKDKGRAEYLLNLEKQLKAMGLRTEFIIAPNGRFAKRKPFYKKYIPYRAICEYLSRSRAVVNVSMDCQEGMTVRDLEAIFNHIKLITTNQSIRNNPAFTDDIAFILDVDEMDDLPEFLDSPYPSVSNDVLAGYSIEHFIHQLTGLPL